jgi:hypothetical protein
MLVNTQVMVTLIVATAWIVPDWKYPVNGSTFLLYTSASKQSYMFWQAERSVLRPNQDRGYERSSIYIMISLFWWTRQRSMLAET